jgi:hypothetical protein
MSADDPVKGRWVQEGAIRGYPYYDVRPMSATALVIPVKDVRLATTEALKSLFPAPVRDRSVLGLVGGRDDDPPVELAEPDPMHYPMQGRALSKGAQYLPGQA